MKKLKLFYNPFSGNKSFKFDLDVCIGIFQEGGYEVHPFRTLHPGDIDTHIATMDPNYDIIVASNGGVYEKELAEAGIRHYHVPLNQRNVLKMARSYFILKKIIKKEKVDIVHSHARIPSFVCGLLKERMKNSFTFVTSAHWVFYTGMGPVSYTHLTLPTIYSV